jgi:hypothetical protein
MQRIFNLAQRFIVELETHPINSEEYEFLTGAQFLTWTTECPPARSFGEAVALQGV